MGKKSKGKRIHFYETSTTYRCFPYLACFLNVVLILQKEDVKLREVK